MILQVNKVKKKEDIQKLNYDVRLELEKHIQEGMQLFFKSNQFERRAGKTTLLIELAKKYDLTIVVSSKKQKVLYSSNDVDVVTYDSLGGHNRGSLYLIDEVSFSENCRLRSLGLKTIGFINDLEQPKKKIYEDYIDVSNVQQKDNMITAEARNGQMNLYRDKKFDDNRDDNYNVNNLDYIIESVYLLDNTGKTIKKLM